MTPLIRANQHYTLGTEEIHGPQHELNILSFVFLAGKFVHSDLTGLAFCNVLRTDSPLTAFPLG